MRGTPDAKLLCARWGKCCALIALTVGTSKMLRAEPVPVRNTQGTIHGFLVLSTMNGKPIAHGDLTQVTHGSRVVLRSVFGFNDGSVRDETAIYSQHGNFRLLSYHLIQKGPSFPHPLEVTADCSTGQVTIRTTGDDGSDKLLHQRVSLPPDLANGLVPVLLTNLPPNGRQTLSFLATTPKPRVVKLEVSPVGEDTFSVAGSSRKATHYAMKIDIGGVAGVVAPMVGKQPSDMQVWVLGGEAPAFLKVEGQLFEDGPLWRIEMASPAWR